MQNKIVLTQGEINVLRGALDTISSVLGSKGFSVVGSQTSERLSSNLEPKETKSQKVKKYADLLANGTRVKKPNYLKK